MKLSLTPSNKRFVIQISIWVSVTLLVAVGSIFGVVQRNLSTLRDEATVYLSSEDERRKDQAAATNLTTALSQEEDIDSAIASINQGFVPIANPLSAITRLEALATDHNLEVTINLGPTPSPNPDNPDAVQQVTTNLELQGNYYDLLEFVQSLKEINMITSIESITIQRRSGSENLVSARIVIRTFWK